MEGTRLWSGCSQFGRELLYVNGNDIEDLALGLLDGGGWLPFERVDIRTLPLFDHNACPLRRPFAKVLLNRVSSCFDRLPQCGDHLRNTKPPIIVKGSYVGRFQVGRKGIAGNVKARFDLVEREAAFRAQI